MAIETIPFDAAEHLESREAQAELLTDAFASGEPAYVAVALRTVARARARAGESSMLAAKAPSQEAERDEDLPLSAVLDMMRALGLRLEVQPDPA